MPLVSDYSRFKNFLESNRKVSADLLSLDTECTNLKGRYVKLITTKNTAGNLEAHFTRLGFLETVKEFVKRLFFSKTMDVYRSDSCRKFFNDRVQKVNGNYVSTTVTSITQNPVVRTVTSTPTKPAVRKTSENKEEMNEHDSKVALRQVTSITPPPSRPITLSMSHGDNSYSFPSHDAIQIQNSMIPRWDMLMQKSLLYFREQGRDISNQLLDLYRKGGYQLTVDNIDGFYEKLDKADGRFLQEINMLDLFADVEESKLKYALLNEQEFAALTLNDLANVSPGQISFIWSRLKKIKDQKQDAIIQPENILDVTIVDLRYMPSKYINSNMTVIPPTIFCFFSDAQVPGLDLEQASVAQIKKLVSTNDDKKNRERFGRLSIGKFNAMHDQLSSDELSLLSDNHIRGLDETKLNKKDLERIFQDKNGVHEENKRRFALLSVTKVNAIFDQLDTYRLGLLSDDHIRGLEEKNLNSKNLKEIFPNKYGAHEENNRHFALLSVKKVNAILHLLDDYGLGLLSDEHIRALDETKLNKENLKEIFPNKYGAHKENNRRFALLSVIQVNATLHLLDDYRFGLLSDEHIRALDETKLNKENLKEIFPNKYGAHEENNRRFALLSVIQVNATLHLLDDYRFGLLSNDHIRGLDETKLNKANLKEIFPDKYGAHVENKKRFELLSVPKINAIFNELDTYRLGLLSKKQITSLSSNQVDSVKGKLDRNTVELFEELGKIS